jgi:Fe2+ transport system protein FeoA
MEAKVAVIVDIRGKQSFRSFLLAQGIVTGTEFTFNYSPRYAGLVNITINNRMLSIRASEFREIEWQWRG